MSIYIYKNNQPAGPFAEENILGWLRAGQLAPEDLACRQGSNEWQKLRTLFPQAESSPSPNAAAANFQNAAAADPSLIRNTTLQRVVTGAVFVLILAAFAGALFYLRSLSFATGELETDLRNMSYRVLARDTAAALFIAAVFTLLGFLLTFKRKLIQTNGVRIVLRGFFIFLISVAALQFAYAAFSYMNHQPPYKTAAEAKKLEQSPLLKALEDGEAATAAIAIPAFHFPLALGFLTLGAAGFFLTQPARRKNP